MVFTKLSNQKGASSTILVVALVVLLVVLAILLITDEGPRQNKLVADDDNVSGLIEDQIKEAKRVQLGESFTSTEGEMLVIDNGSDQLRFEILSFTNDGGVEYEFWVNEEIYEFYADQDAPEIGQYSIEIVAIDNEALTATVIIK